MNGLKNNYTKFKNKIIFLFISLYVYIIVNIQGFGIYAIGDIKKNWCDEDSAFKEICFKPQFSKSGEPTTLNEIINAILLIITYIAIPIIVLGFAYSGFLFFTAEGKPEDLKKAKSILIYSIIGATIIMSAQAIFGLIESTGIAILDV